MCPGGILMWSLNDLSWLLLDGKKPLWATCRWQNLSPYLPRQNLFTIHDLILCVAATWWLHWCTPLIQSDIPSDLHLWAGTFTTTTHGGSKSLFLRPKLRPRTWRCWSSSSGLASCQWGFQVECVTSVKAFCICVALVCWLGRVGWLLGHWTSYNMTNKRFPER